jgi:tetratricopeptide (TPR) repeat protein/tRNA A-37 threonylcarbamoyl transferase component Bud32
MSETPNALVGNLAERYAIECEIGRGATAIVYRARDRVEGRAVAIKLLRAEISQVTAVRHFLREIRNHSGLHHPNIVPVLEAGDHDGQLFLVLPFMEGGTLRERLQREPQLPIVDAVAIARTIAMALEHAHQHGLIHRDVKPENILFTAGEPCLADFGIARALERALGDTSTSAGIVRGTLAYMSPEQASAERSYDGRSDVYSLGCVLYEMLAGVPAFIGPTPEAVLAQRFAHPPRELRVYRPTVSPAVEAVVSKALQFAPADRFRTAQEMAEALSADNLAAQAAVLEGEKRYAAGFGATMSRGRWRIARIAAAAAALVAVFALVQRFGLSAEHFRERDWILVGDFEGPEDDADIANAVRELTTVELNQSRFLSTLPRSQLSATMRLAGVPDTTRVGPQLARELAYRSAVRAVLVGSVKHLGSQNYSIVLHVVNADDGTDIWSAAGAAHDTTLITTVQRLARELRAKLGERRTAIEATLPLYQVATPSFTAYRKYTAGMSLQTRGDGRGSNRLLREALALDTGFASAWFSMGWNYLNDRMLDSARWAFGQALARHGRLSELQRYRLEADAAYTVEYDVPAAIRAYDLYLAVSPRSWAVHNNRGLYLLALNRYEDALESFNRAVAAHPFGPQRAQIQVMNQAATLLALRRVAEAENAARDLTGPFAQYIHLMRATATNRWRDADSAGTAAATAPSSPAWLRVQATAVGASGRASRGAVRSADEMLAHASVDASPDVARWFYRVRALLALVSERSIPALPTKLVTDTSPPGLVTAGLAAVLRNDTATARASLQRLSSALPGVQRRLGSGPTLIAAWLHARKGDWGQAARISASAAQGEHDTALLDRVGSLSLRWLAAEAFARSGRLDSAIAMLELAIKPERMPGNEFAQRGLVVTFAQRRLAQWYSARGSRDSAAKHWRAFLEAFTEPDPELAPLASEARIALRELGET